MDNQEIKSLIGKTIKYYDYLDTERFGRIVGIENNHNDPSAPFIYIEDEEMEYNIHSDIINGSQIAYAEIRLSSEVYLVED